jgi:tetratricopeptide (TPR) repeat protein
MGFKNDTGGKVASKRNIACYGAPDAVAIKNRGNALGALGEWQAAAESFHRAASMSRENVFARANEAFALYEVGRREECVKIMESVLRRYPTFSDVRSYVQRQQKMRELHLEPLKELNFSSETPF